MQSLNFCIFITYFSLVGGMVSSLGIGISDYFPLGNLWILFHCLLIPSVVDQNSDSSLILYRYNKFYLETSKINPWSSKILPRITLGVCFLSLIFPETSFCTMKFLTQEIYLYLFKYCFSSICPFVLNLHQPHQVS